MPSAPTGLVASAGDGKVMLSWTVPNSDGGSPITGYNVYRSTTGGEGSRRSPPRYPSTYTDSAATNGTVYYYTVAAVNAVGTGRSPARRRPRRRQPRPSRRRRRT